MDDSAGLPRLFSLPRELRDAIYFHVLESVAEPPENPSFPGPRFRFRDIMYPKRFAKAPNSSALLVCRQLRDELSDMIANPRTSGIAGADLDIMIKGFMFYPSWTYIPPWLLRAVPFDLNVTFRIFSTESFRSNDGWPRQPGSGFRSLMTLLAQLIQDGPGLYYSAHRSEAHRPFLINRLNVKIIFHDYYTPATHPETTHIIFRMLKALATDGIAGGAIRVIRARAEFVEDKTTKTIENEWDVKDELDLAKAREWGTAGFYYAALVA